MHGSTNSPIMKDLVLVGGGHSHLAVIKRFGMKPVAGLRVTLITRDVHTPYSGMLPGHIAGHYDFDESHIDLRPLALFAGARLYHAEVEGIDLANKTVACRGRPLVSFDVLSINTGSHPSVVNVPGADQHVLPVKPIDAFLRGWEEIVDRARAGDGAFRVVVVGGGAGGVELALATQHRLRQELRRADKTADRLTYHLVTDTDRILPTHNARARVKFMRVLREREITVHAASAVQRVERGRVHCAGGRVLEADSVMWVTHAAAPAWIRESGLATDEHGFIRVNDALQSVSHPEVFAAGDVAAVVDRPRAKSGVFAVRQGPPLANNLRRAVLGKKPRAFTPQTHFLGLISTGDQYAVASRANWSIEGRWVWRVKNWIDRRFMRKYSELPEMEQAQRIELARGIADRDAIKELSVVAMRCGGCGAKVGSTVLARVVNRLAPFERDDVLIGLHESDDAAVIEVPAGKVLVQSVDYFRAFLDDAYVFGKIAANHSLSDIYAMGADPQSAMAVATVPYGREQVVEEQLYQIMAGAVEVLNASRTALVGGHSSEGAELAFGLSVTGTVDRAALLRKGGMKTGDALILTKPLGTGTLFAADMRLKAKGRWIDGAIESMLASNQAAAACLHKYGATACTDVTGFGLLGHLVEMIRPSDGDVELDLDALPVLGGARETIQAGVFSSLQPQNVRLRRAIRNRNGAVNHEHYPLLFDPQTSGGLLASVPTHAAERCLAELHRLGYAQAARIGRVVARENVLEPVRLVSRTLPN